METSVIFSIISLLFSLTQSATVSSRPTSQPGSEHSRFFSCLAKCGGEFGHVTSSVLLSGEEDNYLVVNDEDMKKCWSVCELVGGAPAAEDAIRVPPSTGFQPLELTCVNKLSLFPACFRAHFSALQSSRTAAALHVAEVWRVLAFRNGSVANTLIRRQTSFSPRFTVDYAYSKEPEKEFLLVRLFVYAGGVPDSPLRAYCSDEILPEHVFTGRRDTLNLRLLEVEETERNQSAATLAWTAPDPLYPPECEQHLVWTSGLLSDVRLVQLDGSHRMRVPLLADPATDVHVLTLYPRSEAAFADDRRQAVLRFDRRAGPAAPAAPAAQRLVLDLVPVLALVAIVGLLLTALAYIYVVQEHLKHPQDKSAGLSAQVHARCADQHEPTMEFVTPIKPNLQALRRPYGLPTRRYLRVDESLEPLPDFADSTRHDFCLGDESTAPARLQLPPFSPRAAHSKSAPERVLRSPHSELV